MSNKVPSADVIALIPELRMFARTFYRDDDEADDLVQETLLRAIDNLHELASGLRLKPWLLAIMRNASSCGNGKKTARERAEIADRAAPQPEGATPRERPCRGAELQAAFERLSENQREMIMLVGALGLSYEEAAEICGCETRAVKGRLNRARVRLAAELQENSDRTIFEDVEFRSKPM